VGGQGASPVAPLKSNAQPNRSKALREDLKEREEGKSFLGFISFGVAETPEKTFPSSLPFNLP
jgi:hypothetical protein